MWDIILALVCIFVAIYLWLTWNYDYWKRNGVPYVEPAFPFGTMKDLLLMRKHIGAVYADFYWKYPNEAAVGIYKLMSPQLVLRDPELIKTVFVKEFNSFHDNEFELDPTIDPIGASNPFLAKGENWKALRSFHTHTQSSGKIKGMFMLVMDICKDMAQFVEENEDKPIEAKYFSGQFTTDVVASCVYGIKTNSFLDPKAEFRRMSAKLFVHNFYFDMFFLILSFVPKLNKILRLRFVPKEVTNFFVKVVADISEYRRTNKVSRADFLQTMLDENLKSDKPKYTFEEITAHTMTFFLDGYETSSTLMSHAIYLLGLYPEYQEKIRDEIKEAGQITYDEIHKFKYLDAVVNETLRMYPPGLVLTRLCTKDISLKAGERTYPICKGMTVALPVFALHKDPANFPDPEQFIPDRFYEKQAPAGFFPFGMGPRACLGSRFALTLVKTGIAYLVQNFQIIPRDYDAKLPPIDKTSSFLLPPKSGLWVKFESLKDK